jgi:hypothetical protein
MQNDLYLVSLRSLIQAGDERLLEIETQLKEFSCARNTDVQSFIREKAIRYERSGLSRAYLYLKTNKSIGNRYSVVAYFAIAITSVDFTGVSRSKRTKVLGGTPGRDDQEHFGGLLVAQLARDDSYDSAVIDGTELLEDCEAMVEQGRIYLGGRMLYVDCREELVRFYERNGYKVLKTVPEERDLFTMFKGFPRL